MPDNMDTQTLRLYALAHPVTALGPGNRAVLWVAGCKLRCPGCISPEMQDTSGGQSVSVERLSRRLLCLDPNLTGLTISGGEPFDQAASLSELLRQIRATRPCWSVIIYSGYPLEKLNAKLVHRDLLRQVDVLIDGPYLANIPSAYALAGSGNQQFHYLTSQGLAMKTAIQDFPRQSINIGLGPGNLNMIIGVTAQSTRQIVERALFMLPESVDEEQC